MSAIDNVLAHYGRKGMKWGVRRRSTSSTEPASDDHKNAAVARTKSASSLSNTEMQSLITRMNLEQQYTRLTTSVTPVNASRTSKATKFVKDLLLDVGKEQVTRVARAQGMKSTNAAALKNGLDIPELLKKKKG
jgi:K+-transporting ATPase c subunit